MVEETKDTDELKNEKENRRRELLQQLDAGTLEKQEDIEFLLNQYLKDNEINLSEKGRENLKKILTEGRGNFKSIFDQYKEIQSQNLLSRLKTEVYPIGGAEAMTSTQMQGHTVNLDLGLSDVLAKMDKVQAKDNLYQDIIKAREIAAKHKYEGIEDHTGLRSQLYDSLESTKWYQFKRRRDTNKAIRDINPDDYWATKKVSGNPILAASGYYSARQWLANRQHRRYESAKKQLETNVKDTIRDSELRWFSKDFGQKLGLRAKKLFRPSTDKLIKRLTANGNITELQDIKQQYAALGTEYKAKVPEGSRTQLQQRYFDTVTQVIEQVNKGCQDRITVLNKEYDQAIEDAGNIRSPEVENIREKYIAQLDKVADSINKNTLNDVRNCPAYKAYLKAHKGKPDESGFTKVTGKDVLKQILDNKVQSGEISQEEADKQMEIFYPKQVETPISENSQTEEHKQENDVSKDTIAGNQKEEKDINEEDYTPFEIDAKTLPGYEKEGENTYLSTSKGNVKNISYKNAKGHTVQFLQDKEKRSFVLKARDENGNRRYPTVEEEKTMAEAIKAAGVKSITIDRTYGVENCYNALKSAGIAINNEEEVLKRIEKERDRKNTIQKLRDEHKDLVMKLEQVQGENGSAFGEYDIDKILYENKDSIERDPALFEKAIDDLTPEQAEEMRGKENIGTQVKEVVESKSSTEAKQEVENDAHPKNDSGNGQGSGSGDAQDEASKGESDIPSIVSSNMEDSIKTPSVEDSNQPTAEQGKENENNSDNKKNSDNKEINLQNVTDYIKGLRPEGLKELKEAGKDPKKFSDLNEEERKLARQLHAHRMNIIKQAKKKGIKEEDIYTAAEQGTVNWLKGRLSNTTSTKKRDKQIKELANANVRISRPKQSESGRG